MVVVDHPDILIPTFKWIYPSVLKTRIIENTTKKKSYGGSTTVFLFFNFFFLEKCFLIWYDLISYKSGLKIRFSNHIIFHKNFILLIKINLLFY